jgi:pimeloyl-ACP methyl ester carboxylesterase
MPWRPIGPRESADAGVPKSAASSASRPRIAADCRAYAELPLKPESGLAGPATFTVIGGAPHASNVTHPSAVNAEIADFLGKLAG